MTTLPFTSMIKLLCVISLLFCGLTHSVVADPAYPNKPIRIVVPFTPGGSPDVLARTIGQKLSEATGVAVVVENIAGAGGTIGADRVAKASPDGYTLLMACGHTSRGAFCVSSLAV